MMIRSMFLVLVVGLLTFPAWAEDYLVPLDDRPANRLFVEQLARIGRPQEPLRTVPRHLLGRFFTPGDCSGIAEWVQQRARPGDTLFVSADMWLYGGLVASRTASVTPEQVKERLAALQALSDKGVKLHVLATIPRLSLRTSDQQAAYERALADWAVKPELPSARELRALIDQEELGDFAPQNVPVEPLAEYLEVRIRNTDTIIELIRMAGHGAFESLVLGQDDSHKTGIHKFEHTELHQAIEDFKASSGVTLLSGIDELTMNMVAGEFARRHGHTVSMRVIYSEPEAADKVPPLETIPLGRMVEQHLVLSGARLHQGDGAEVDLFVYVPSDKPWGLPGEERRPQSEQFVLQVSQAMESGRRVAVADLSLVNRMDPFLAESVLDRLKLYELQGFASWNTPANTVGTVIAQVVNHRIAETSPSWTLNQRLESEKTHQAFLIARMIDDFGYQTVVRDEVRPMAADLPAVSDPLLNLFGPVGTTIRLRLVEWANKTFENHFLGQKFCLQPQGKQVQFHRSKLEVVLPWGRLFEVEARLDVRLSLTGEDCPD